MSQSSGRKMISTEDNINRSSALLTVNNHIYSDHGNVIFQKCQYCVFHHSMTNHTQQEEDLVWFWTNEFLMAISSILNYTRTISRISPQKEIPSFSATKQEVNCEAIQVKTASSWKFWRVGTPETSFWFKSSGRRSQRNAFSTSSRLNYVIFLMKALLYCTAGHHMPHSSTRRIRSRLSFNILVCVYGLPIWFLWSLF